MLKTTRLMTPALIVAVCSFAVADDRVSQPATAPTCSAIQQIADTLQQIRSDQRALVMIRLVELGDRRMAPLRDEARRARNEVRRMTREVTQIEADFEMMNEHWNQQIENGADPEQDAFRFEIEQYENLIELRKEDLRTAELRASEAENDLARQQSRIADLDAKLEELLEMLDSPD